MENTLFPGDLILVDKAALGVDYLPISSYISHVWRMNSESYCSLRTEKIFPSSFLKKPTRNDLLVFSRSNNGDKNIYVKRTIGLSGDKIELKEGELLVNGISLKKLSSQKNAYWVPNDLIQELSREKALATILEFGGIHSVPDFTSKKNVEAKFIVCTPQNFQALSTFYSRYKFLPVLKMPYNWSDTLFSIGHKWNNWDMNNYGPIQVPENDGNNLYFLLGDNRNLSIDSRSWGFISEEEVIGKVMLIFSNSNNRL